MSERREIAVSNLLLDIQNPRLAQGQQTQLETLHAMLRAEGPKTLALAESIAHEGLSPIERLIVIPSPDQPKRYIVLEGNRRLTALRILSEPALATPVLTSAQNKKLAKWSADYRNRGEISRVECVVFETREAANSWIERRHRGDKGGLGIVRWGATESARFDARRPGGKYVPELQVLDFVLEHGDLDADTRERLHNVSISNLERLISDKVVRQRIGLAIHKGRVETLYPAEEVLKPLTRILRDLAHEKVKVSQIYDADDRLEYIKTFKAGEMPRPTKALEDSEPLLPDLPPSPTSGSGGSSDKTTKTPKPRTVLIPGPSALKITVPKIADIARELRKLKLEDYPNAIAVLFRVFIELSVDEVIEKNSLMTEQQLDGAKLRDKLTKAADHLQSQQLLTTQQAKAVKKAATDQHLLHSSITTLHQYVHNKHFTPSTADLRAGWDNLQPFIEAIWR
jgi:FtsZ-binding cell division protein ZapB